MGVQITPWTAEDLATVKTLWLKGESGSYIAKAIGYRKSRNAIIGVITRRGWKRPRSVALSNSRHVSKSRKRQRVPKSQLKTPATRAKGDMPKTEKPKAVAPSNDPVAFEQLTPDTCRYAVNNGEPWMFCGAKTVARGKPYCAYHTKLCGGGYGS